MDEVRIRDAATVILVRDIDNDPKILMGQRGARAAFMPNKFVFPGGAVDAGDATIPLEPPLAEPCAQTLLEHADANLAHALQVAAVRELWEETGLVLGAPGDWPDPPADWADFAATGHRPAGSAFQFIFRAITPPGRPRRFDARFFMADAAAISGDPDDFSAASDELSALQWVSLAQAREFDLPFITEVVLAEVALILREGGQKNGVPFFQNDDEQSLFLRLGRQSPFDQPHN